MTARVTVVLTAVLLFFGGVASAHRLDEYLQATMLSLQPGHVQASMRMVPGVLEAQTVIRAIDTNGDGVFSQQEELAYASRVLQDLVVQLNGTVVQPRLVSWQFPQPAQLRDGLGEMRLEYAIDLPHGGGDRHLLLTNRHMKAASVYLVNVEVPDEANFCVLRQERSPEQSAYALYFRQEQTSSVPAGHLAAIRGWLEGMQIASLFALGMRHIAEGTDHLLFLLPCCCPRRCLPRSIVGEARSVYAGACCAWLPLSRLSPWATRSR